MDKETIENTIIQILQDLQAGTGEVPVPITRLTNPLSELGFFDSLLALETTCELEVRLGSKLEDQSVFWDKQSAKKLTITEIADRLLAKEAA